MVHEQLAAMRIEGGEIGVVGVNQRRRLTFCLEILAQVELRKIPAWIAIDDVLKKSWPRTAALLAHQASPIGFRPRIRAGVNGRAGAGIDDSGIYPPYSLNLGRREAGRTV